jgi:hypothetical protein
MSSVWILVCDSAKARFFEAREGQASVGKDMNHLNAQDLEEALRESVRVPLDERDGARGATRRAH